MRFILGILLAAIFSGYIAVWAWRNPTLIPPADPPMSFREVTSRPLSFEYPFTWVQFKIRPDGTGDGKLFVAARIVGEEADDLIEVQDFAISPVRLQNITSRKGN